jgi:hypothetical protein
MKIEHVKADLGELAQRAAKEIAKELDQGLIDDKRKADEYQYSTEEAYWCIVHTHQSQVLGRPPVYEAEVLDKLPYGLPKMSAIGPSPRDALRRLHWVFARFLVNGKVCSEEQARRRAARAKFRLAG